MNDDEPIGVAYLKKNKRLAGILHRKGASLEVYGVEHHEDGTPKHYVIKPRRVLSLVAAEDVNFVANGEVDEFAPKPSQPEIISDEILKNPLFGAF